MIKDMKCPCTGAYIPRFALAIIVGFAAVFGYDFAVHHHLLMDLYEATTDLWRAPEQMQEFFPYMLGFQLATTFVAAAIFVQNYEKKGIMEGLRFGLWLGLLLGVLNANAWVWLPIPAVLAGAWFAAGLGKGILLGVVYSLTYKEKDCG